MDWLPIETAPFDKFVLIRYTTKVKKYRFVTKQKKTISHIVQAEKRLVYNCSTMVEKCEYWYDTHYRLIRATPSNNRTVKITHWMELPDEPRDLG